MQYLENCIGGWWVCTHGSAFQSDGIPDILGMYNGTFYAFELKREDGKGKPRIKQLYNVKRIKDEGGVAMFVDDINQIVAVFGIPYD